ncbi:MAG: hypothetical protein JSS27_04365 [Planctomycetes bacterium]|nr:hypothetical protein [Planctomycetota bacterium]
MASGENQGLQIAIIILFIVVICLAVGTFMFFNQNTTNYARYKAEQDKVTEGDKSFRAELAKVTKLMQFIGLPEDADIDKAQATFVEDKGKYFSALPEESQVYRKAIEALAATTLKLQDEKNTAQAKITELEAVNDATRKATEEQVKTANEARMKAEMDLATEKAKFMEAQKNADGEMKKLADQLAKAQQDGAAELDKANKTVEALTKQIATTDGKVKVQSDKIRDLLGNRDIELDDGEIRVVDARTNTVWINVGSADALRTQITFDVHSPDAAASDVAARKGAIEVTKIMGEHLAEARITDQKPHTFLLPGDKIYTSLWDPGRPEHFAIVGRIDFDGDGSDDREKLKNIIALSGGVIDAEVDNDGKTTGKITSDTRYIIEGPIAERARTQIEKLTKEGETMGAVRVGVDRFLDSIGYRATAITARYGLGSDVTKLRTPPQIGRGASGYTDAFKARKVQRLPSDPATSDSSSAASAGTPAGGATRYYRFP